MIPLVADNFDKIAALCRQYRIQKLELFGSAMGEVWDSDTSDIDLIADLGEYELGVADRYLDFAHALEALHQAELTESEAVADLAILRRAVDTRNRIVRGYASVDYGVVWDIATERLPELRVQLEEKLRDAPLSSYGAVG